MNTKTYFSLVLLFVSALSINTVHAQEKIREVIVTPQSDNDDLSNKIFVVYTESPRYIEGDEAFHQQFIAKFKRPKKIAKDVAIDLRLNFTVKIDGSLSDIKVVKSPGYGTEEEAIHVLKQLGNWKPANNNGRAFVDEADVSITIPPAKKQKK